MLRKYDSDRNGLLAIDEFAVLVHQLRQYMAAQIPHDVRDAFNSFDKNRSGQLDYRELRNAVRVPVAAAAAVSPPKPLVPRVRRSSKGWGSTSARKRQSTCWRATTPTATGCSTSASSGCTSDMSKCSP